MNTPPPPIDWTSRPYGTPDGTHHVITLPWARPFASLSANARAGHWRARSRDTREVRETVMLLARSARIPVCSRMTVMLRWAPGDRIRRDEDNLYGFQKAAADALARGPRRDWVGLDLLPDDTPQFMQKLTPMIVPPPARGLWLDVWTVGPPWTEKAA